MTDTPNRPDTTGRRRCPRSISDCDCGSDYCAGGRGTRYTRWSQPYEAALARGHDHGSAAFIGDAWEQKHMHLTGGTGIIKGVRHG